MEHHHHHHHHHHGSGTSEADLDRDVRRQMFRRAMAIMPAVILVIGFLVWTYAAEKGDYSSMEKLKRCGGVLMLFGGGILFVFLVGEWFRKLRTYLKDRKEKHRHHHHHHHHHHHSGDDGTESGGGAATASQEEAAKGAAFAEGPRRPSRR